jgi:hypothetical protein
LTPTFADVLLVRPIQDYAKSSIYVALHHMSVPGGDLMLARQYLERVAGSNAEEVAQASDLLKKVKQTIQEKQEGKGKGRMVVAEMGDTPGSVADAMMTDQ